VFSCKVHLARSDRSEEGGGKDVGMEKFRARLNKALREVAKEEE